jgi:Ni,Fe-hydrogenase III component G
MRLTALVLAANVFAVPAGTATLTQTHAPSQHGQQVMGFDQDKTVHHFLLYDDGGTIDVSVKDAADAQNRDAIRAHLPHIAMMFGTGDFAAPMLVHESPNVPGTAVMAARKQAIKYVYRETPRGGRVDILTVDRDALAAVHQFLKYQIAEHKTGDPGTIGKR